MSATAQDRLLNWWNNGDQERPCLLVTCPSERQPEYVPASLDDYWLDPASHEMRAMEGILGRRWFGEALPYHYVDFGAATLCGMQGSPVRYTNAETIWVDSLYATIGEAIGAAVDPALPFSRDVRDSFKAVVARLAGKAMVAPYCVGSPCDNLAGLIGTENFLYALYDEPESLRIALRRQLDLWESELGWVLSELQPSATAPMTGWHGIWAPGSTFPIQEDIGYMLGEEHYLQFCLPGIQAMVECLDYPFFHLDGVGALKHLDALLKIEKLKVIQWQPGDGRMRVMQWVDAIAKILKNNKSCQLYVQPDEVAPLIDAVGAKGLLLIVHTDREQALRLAERYGLDETIITKESFR